MLRGLIMTACCGLLMTVILPSLRIIEQAWKSAATANLLPLSTMALVLSLILLTHARPRQDARRSFKSGCRVLSERPLQPPCCRPPARRFSSGTDPRTERQRLGKEW